MSVPLGQVIAHQNTQLSQLPALGLAQRAEEVVFDLVLRGGPRLADIAVPLQSAEPGGGVAREDHARESRAHHDATVVLTPVGCADHEGVGDSGATQPADRVPGVRGPVRDVVVAVRPVPDVDNDVLFLPPDGALGAEPVVRCRGQAVGVARFAVPVASWSSSKQISLLDLQMEMTSEAEFLVCRPPPSTMRTVLTREPFCHPSAFAVQLGYQACGSLVPPIMRELPWLSRTAWPLTSMPVAA